MSLISSRIASFFHINHSLFVMMLFAKHLEITPNGSPSTFYWSNMIELQAIFRFTFFTLISKKIYNYLF